MRVGIAATREATRTPVFIPVSVYNKNVPPDKKNLWSVSLKSTKSRGGEQLLLFLCTGSCLTLREADNDREICGELGDPIPEKAIDDNNHRKYSTVM